VVLIRDNQIIVGNVGDSQCLLSVNGQVPNLAFSFVITNGHKWSLKYCLFPLYPKTMVLTHSHVPCDVDESERIQFSGGYLISDWWKIRNPEHRAGGLVALKQPSFCDTTYIKINRYIFV
jgi:hypothetical protein